MQLPCLITSDIHLTDRPDDEYRWGLFPWLTSVCKEEKIKTLLILGDITDAKDRHSAELVNRLVKAIAGLPVPEIKILAGNHDWLKSGQEFFKFLNVLPNVEFITQPTEDSDVNGESAYYLPYSKNPAKDWAGLDFSHYHWLFLHQTIKGAIASNGQEMDGEELPALNAGKVYSGDIHVPQKIGPLEYVGSPYHVHFGDAFVPRCILLEKGGRPVDLHFKTISRVSLKVSSFKELVRAKLQPGDQIKLTFELHEAEKHEWSKIRREVLAHLQNEKVDVHGIKLVVAKPTRRLLAASKDVGPAYSPADAVERFIEAEELGGEAYETAMEILDV